MESHTFTTQNNPTSFFSLPDSISSPSKSSDQQSSALEVSLPLRKHVFTLQLLCVSQSEEKIASRTRSKLPLHDTSLSSLEGERYNHESEC